MSRPAFCGTTAIPTGPSGPLPSSPSSPHAPVLLFSSSPRNSLLRYQIGRSGKLDGMTLRHVIAGVALVASLAASGAAPEPCDSSPLLVRNTNVWTPDGMLAGRDVVFRDGRVAAIGPAGAGRHDRTRTIDGTGHTLLPGLVDSHLHLTIPGGLPAGDAPRTDIEDIAGRQLLRSGSPLAVCILRRSKKRSGSKPVRPARASRCRDCRWAAPVSAGPSTKTSGTSRARRAATTRSQRSSGFVWPESTGWRFTTPTGFRREFSTRSVSRRDRPVSG